MGFTMTPDGMVIYFTSNRANGVTFNLYTSRRPSPDAPWLPPVEIAELNTPWEDKFPSVTADDLTLYFASNRPGSVPAGDGTTSRDIWVAMRPTPWSEWSVVENVAEINTEHSEYLMSIADDGSELFYAADLPGSAGILDLYRVDTLPGVTRYGIGSSGEAGVPTLSTVGGPARLGNAGWGLQIRGVSPTAFGVLVIGPAPAPGPIHVDLLTAGALVFQTLGLGNPSAEEARTIALPLPNDPVILGFTTHVQALMLWDLQGAGEILSVPFAASPALRITVVE